MVMLKGVLQHRQQAGIPGIVVDPDTQELAQFGQRLAL
jgi:hypothetical protein